MITPGVGKRMAMADFSMAPALRRRNSIPRHRERKEAVPQSGGRQPTEKKSRRNGCLAEYMAGLRRGRLLIGAAGSVVRHGKGGKNRYQNCRAAPGQSSWANGGIINVGGR
jgi:hypothetical protein